ncbi:MAG TPA: alpha/beta hydrolase [Streptosporangiaceae bacterium]|nr:alpha/beta hydrolase [Streptosporangiaceae bacterium]
MELQELDAHRHTAPVRSGEISYLDVGTGPVALFVHGVGTSSYLWRNVIGAVAGRGRRCVALDLPLHGRTPVHPGQDLSVAALASMLEDFCDALGLTGIDLVGNDTGGAIAQVFAARHPGRLSTLTLTNCDVSENLPPEAFKPVVALAAAGRLAPAALALLDDDIDAAARASFGAGYEFFERADRAVIRAYLEPCVGTIERGREFERLLTSLDAADLVAVEPQLRMLSVPTLLVWGTGDVFFDVSWAYWLRDTIPGASGVVTIEGARLFFPEERPADLVPHLEQHWAAARRATPVA